MKKRDNSDLKEKLQSAVSLSDDQQAAFEKISEWFLNKDKKNKKFFYLSGYAGTGKTYLMSKLGSLLDIDEDEILYVTPTGKSSNVLNKKGIPAKTIYRSIYETRVEEIECYDEKKKKKYKKNKTTF